jgi:60 kDa SS-A/Ro ribonucleoprotein
MTKYSDIIKPRVRKSYPPTGTSQLEPALPTQIPNNEGGYVFAVDMWKRLERFLILGSTSPTYYVDAKTLTLDNAKVVVECAQREPARTANMIIDISDKGRAYKNDTALFALAVMASLGGEPQKFAYASLHAVARIPTHLFMFNENLNAVGVKWNRSRRNAIANWYNEKSGRDISYQMVKYQNRNGWTHKDLLRLAHVKPTDAAHSAAFQWATHGIVKMDAANIISTYEEIKAATDIKQVVKLIQDHSLTWEFVPTEWLGKAEVWAALLPNLPPTALLRNLGRMTANGLLTPLSDAASYVRNFFENNERMKNARVHPFALLVAQRTYAQGKGVKGSLRWEPVPIIVESIETAFYDAFNYTEPTGKRFLWCQDVSASMGGQAGEVPLTCAEAGAAMALTIAKTEDNYHCMGFNQGLQDLRISKRTTLAEAHSRVDRVNSGGTDCALPMQWALKSKIPVDCFVVCTDNETHSGRTGHPFKALEQYRQGMGIDARLIVLAMTPTIFSIANPDDAGMLDIAGMDTNVPGLITDFARGSF